MKYYIKNILEKFPCEVKPQTIAPSNNTLFKFSTTMQELDNRRIDIFRIFLMKAAIFLCKRAWSDIEPAVSFLLSRTKHSKREQQEYFLRMVGFLIVTIDDVLILEADGT